MIGGFVVEGSLIGAAGCAVWEGAVLARRWFRDTRQLRKLATYLDKTRQTLRDVALSVWTSEDPSLRGLAHSLLDVAAELETAVDRCRAQRWRPRREHTQQLSNLLATSQMLRRTAHDPRLAGTSDAASLGVIADSFRRTVALGKVVEPRYAGATAPSALPASSEVSSPAPAVDRADARTAAVARAIQAGLAVPNRTVGHSADGEVARPVNYVGKHREKNTKFR